METLKNRTAKIAGLERYRKFALAILLTGDDSDDVRDRSILFEVRAGTLRTQPGDICFPGGHVESGEEPLRAAIREACEELLITEDQLEYIGPADYLVNDKGRIFYPFIFYLKGYEGTYSRDEVERTLTVPVSFFMETEPEIYYTHINEIPEDDFPFHRIVGGRDYKWSREKRPCYFYDYKGTTIWGLTGRILYYLARTLTDQ